MLFARALARLVRIGRLELIDAGGERHMCVGAPGPAVTVRLHDRSLYWKFVVNPRLYVAEAYMDGALTVEEGSLYDFVELLVLNAQEGYFLLRLTELLAVLKRRFDQYNPVPRAQRNAAHHYDLSEQLYELFLDHDRQYSCAYFFALDDLETAQLNKKRHLASKLLLRPGQKVLDIGCGWGGLALYLAGDCDVDVTGLTLSAEQHKVAQRRAAAAGLAERCVSSCATIATRPAAMTVSSRSACSSMSASTITMEFFGQVKDLLSRDGVALLHSIGRMDGPASPIRGCASTSSRAVIARRCRRSCRLSSSAGLWVTDIEILRLHYAETLRAWRARFNENRDRIARFMTSASAGCGNSIWPAAR